MNCANCGRPIFEAEPGHWMHRIDGGGDTDCRLSATPPRPASFPGHTLDDIRSHMKWWRTEARDLRTSRRTLEIQAGRRMDDLLTAIENE